MKNTCRICFFESNENVFSLEEVRQNTKETFDYFKCTNCGSVQIATIPSEMDKYYENYYSLERVAAEKKLRSIIRREVFKYRLSNQSLFGKFVSILNPNMFAWIRPKTFHFNSNILDIGCGNGSLLHKMAESGFTSLTGVDPFIQKSLKYKINNVDISIYKDKFENLSEKYDVIMLHHVIEHMDDQQDFFLKIKKLMHSKSKLIFVLPIISDRLWDIYGAKGFQFEDIPRHFYIHSKKSFEIILSNHGFKIISSVSFFEKKVLNDIHGNCSIKNKNNFKNVLLKEQDTGLISYYVELV